MGRGAATVTGSGPYTEALGFSSGGQGGKGWAASLFKEAWPALGVGEPSLAL